MSLNPLEILKLSEQAKQIKLQLNEATASESPDKMRIFKLSVDLVGIQKKLGKTNSIQVKETTGQVHQKTSIFYSQKERRTKGERQKENNAAIELLRDIQATGRKPTDNEKSILAKFSGYGGNLEYVDDDGQSRFGSRYEYYTPAPIAEGVWGLIEELGFSGGKVLDPSSGSGVFAATRPQSAVIDQVELSNVSGSINALVNDSDTCKTTISPFEAVASATPDETYDAIVTNVPFASDLSARGSNNKLDKKWQNDTIETYFILRSLDKLKPNGLAAFIVPPRIVSDKDKKAKTLRTNIALRSEFLGAYRLPNSVFDKASDADTIVDVIVMRKFSKDAKQKIDELNEQNIQALIDSNVLWQEFIDGQYFMGEGRKFVLGDFVAKDPNKIRDVDRVISDQSTANIAKLLKKFPDSHINWDLLNISETAPISYDEGQVVYQDGQTLKFTGGKFVAVDSVNDENSKYDDLSIKLDTPINAVSYGLKWEDADAFVQYMRMKGKALEVPAWLTKLWVSTSKKISENERHDQFNLALAGLSIYECYEVNGSNEPFNYFESYAVLNGVIQVASKVKISTSYPKDIKDKSKLVRNAFSKNEFSNRWKGIGNQSVKDENLDAVRSYEQLVYSGNVNDYGFVEIAKLKELYGADFDPINSDEWCVDGSGLNVIKADDYYVGNYGDLLEFVDTEYAKATDPVIKEKLLKQKQLAKTKVDFPDVGRMKFTMTSPFISMDQKLAFLRENVHKDIFIEMKDNGKPKFSIKFSGKRTEKEWLIGRYVDYLSRGSLTTLTSKEDIAKDPVLEAEKIAKLRELRTSVDARLNVWIKTDRRAFSLIKENMEDPKRIYFKRVEDTAKVDIEGWNSDIELHGYQNAEVRSQTKKFGGILGFGTGLGKTLTSLATVQYIQSIGIKKKTVFVVPNSVLTNWKKEASRGLKSIDDCLFIGLDVKDGVAKLDSSNYARDMNTILENRHKKIFMTLSAFTAIPVRDETIEAYGEYITSNDPTYAEKRDNNGNVKQADVDKLDAKKTKVSEFGEKNMAFPFFEDMNIDSIVIDEAHMAKNSKFVVDFKSAAYLSTADASNRGLDVQLKSWYIRGLSSRGDGVLCLTATPITNSPLEIYGMLSIAVGETELNKRLGIFGADQFMDAFSSIEYSEEPDIIGNMRSVRTFTGIQNVQLLRTALSQIANIKDADDVGEDVLIPEYEESHTAVQLDKESIKTLIDYKRAYKIARAISNNNDVIDPDDFDWYNAFKEREGVDNDDLLAHPFNVISKMTNVILDREIDSGETIYKISGQLDKAKKTVEAFNKKSYKVESTKIPKNFDEKDIASQKVKKVDPEEDGSGVLIYKLIIRARIENDKIIFPSVDFDIQNKFLAIADAQGLDVDVNLSPKIAALISNIKTEMANPKAGITKKQAKQIIFCDALSAHNKLKLAIHKQCGIPKNKIVIINAVSVPDAADMQDVQDGFNGEDDDNKYSIVIANKKAEVGINLQVNTQAIHHLTLGWTPDSLTQRNGRGVRQGNKLGVVNIYYYNADGTFDDYKRMLVDRKGDWINSVMKGEADNVSISGGISAEDMDDMVNAMGDKDAQDKIKDRIALREKERKVKVSREAQTENARIIKSQTEWLDKYETVRVFANEKRDQLSYLEKQKAEIADKIGRVKSPVVANRLQVMLSDVIKKHAELDAYIKESTDGYSIIEGSKLDIDYNYQKESIESSINGARIEFNKIHAESEGAYKSNVIDMLLENKAVILNGKIISEGMIAVNGNAYYIAAYTKPTDGKYYSPKSLLLVNPKAKTAVNIARGQSYDWYCESDSNWPVIAESVAAIDDETINATTGLSDDDIRLFSSFNADIASRLTAERKTDFMQFKYAILKSPYFKYVVSPLVEKETELSNFIISNQSKVLTWDEQNYRVSIIAEYYDMDSSSWTSVLEKISALVMFAKANGLKVTVDDSYLFGSSKHGCQQNLFYALNLAYPEVEKTFNTELVNIIKASNNADEIDSAVSKYFSGVFDGILSNPEFLKSYLNVNGLNKAIDAAKQSLLLGKRPILMLDTVTNSNAANGEIVDYILSAAKEKIDSIEGNIDHVAKIVVSVIDTLTVDGGMDGFLQLIPDFSEKVVNAYDGEKQVGAFVVLENNKVSEQLQMAFLNAYGRREVSEFIKFYDSYKLAKAQEKGGFSIDEIMGIKGVLGAEIGQETINAQLFRGNFTFESAKYVAVHLDFGSPFNKKLMDKEDGIKGRFFDNARGSNSKKWLFTIADDAKSSKGEKMASVKDLIDFYKNMK